jgi:hypothetical protein
MFIIDYLGIFFGLSCEQLACSDIYRIIQWLCCVFAALPYTQKECAVIDEEGHTDRLFIVCIDRGIGSGCEFSLC